MAKESIKKVVDSGTDGIWTWKKYADGTAECYGNYTASVTCESVVGYYRGALTHIPYPQGLFVSAPTVIATCQTSSYWTSVQSASTSEIETVFVYDVISGTGTSTFGFHVLGRWK